MKKNRLNYKLLPLLLVAVLVCFDSCKKLDEQVYSSETSETFFKNADQVLSAYLMPYSFMQTHIYQVHFAIQEFTTDEAVAPVRGSKRGCSMCEICVELDKRIIRLKRIAAQLLDPETVEAATQLVGEMEARKKALHPDQE